MSRKDTLRQLMADHNLTGPDIARIITKEIGPHGGRLTKESVEKWMAPRLKHIQPPPATIALLQRILIDRAQAVALLAEHNGLEVIDITRAIKSLKKPRKHQGAKR